MSRVRLPRQTRGLTREERKRLRAAIAKFYKKAKREKWDKPTYAKDMCNHASDDFLHCLARFKLEPLAAIEHYDFERTSWHTCTQEEAMYGRMRYPFPWCGQWHWAVRVGDNLIIDWTARQFDGKAPFPAMWIDERPNEYDDYERYLMAQRDGYRYFVRDHLVSDDWLSGTDGGYSLRPRRLRTVLQIAPPIPRVEVPSTRGRRPGSQVAATG
jgi:hypothetical protein